MPTLTSELNRGPRELIRASKRVRYHLTKYVRGIFNPPYRYGAQSRFLRVRGRSGELRCGEYRDHPGTRVRSDRIVPRTDSGRISLAGEGRDDFAVRNDQFHDLGRDFCKSHPIDRLQLREDLLTTCGTRSEEVES